jgi:hypothetical protein
MYRKYRPKLFTFPSLCLYSLNLTDGVSLMLKKLYTSLRSRKHVTLVYVRWMGLLFILVCVLNVYICEFTPSTLRFTHLHSAFAYHSLCHRRTILNSPISYRDMSGIHFTWLRTMFLLCIDGKRSHSFSSENHTSFCNHSLYPPFSSWLKYLLQLTLISITEPLKLVGSPSPLPLQQWHERTLSSHQYLCFTITSPFQEYLYSSIKYLTWLLDLFWMYAVPYSLK